MAFDPDEYIKKKQGEQLPLGGASPVEAGVIPFPIAPGANSRISSIPMTGSENGNGFDPDTYIVNKLKDTIPLKDIAIQGGKKVLETAFPGTSGVIDAAESAKDVYKDPARLLPIAGATALTALAPEAAPLGRVGLAMLGGGGGEGVRQLYARLRGQPTPFTSTEAAKDIGVEGLKQGALQLGGEGVNALAENVALPLGKKALGFTKRFLNKEPKAEQAIKTVQTMGQEGVMGVTKDTEDMISKVQDLASKSGKKIGDYLKRMGSGFDPNGAIAALNDLRPRKVDGVLLGVNNAPEGEKSVETIYTGINQKIDKAIDTIRAHGEGPLSFEDMNKLKNLFQQRGNFKNFPDATELDRQIAGKFRQYLDDSLEKASAVFGGQSGHQEFLKNKEIYRAANHAEDGLFNRLSSEEGNKKLGLTDVIAGSAAAGAGMVHGGGLEAAIGAAGILTLKRLGELYGPQAAFSLARSMIANPSAASTLLRLATEAVSQYVRNPEKGMVPIR